MPKRTLKIKVSAVSNVDRYWIKIDDKEVAHTGKAEGQVTVSTGSHRLVYWAIGTPGGKLTIEISKGGDQIIKKTPRIPADGDVANAPRFDVS